MTESPIPANAGNKFASLMRRKVFGVPVLVFALLAAAVMLYFAIRMKSVPDVDDGGKADPQDFGGDEGSGLGTPIFRALDLPVNDFPNDPEDPRTNKDWSKDCITWLIQQGHEVDISTRAIIKYLGKHPLSMQERELVDKALRQFGPPPDGYINSPPIGGGPPVRQGNPPTIHTVRGGNDNNPKELTLLYYGRSDREATIYLIANNVSKRPPWARGSQVRIPLYRSPKYFRSTRRLNTAPEIARRNGTSAKVIIALNPGMDFPVPPNTRVRVQ